MTARRVSTLGSATTSSRTGHWTETILLDAKSCLQNKTKLNLKYKVKNTFRSIGTQLSGEIAYRYG